jgi:hypothetical protein
VKRHKPAGPVRKVCFKAAFVFLFLFVFSTIASADGRIITLGMSIIDETDQYALISCGQTQETMVVGTTFLSDSPLGDQVWIVPIISKTPPKVTPIRGDFSGELKSFINQNVQPFKDQSRIADRVRSYLNTQYDIYNISVLLIST